jgi:hypothetical protein
VPQFTVRSGNQSTDASCGAGATVANAGPSTVYFRDEPTVSATANDGSIASGSSTVLYGNQFFWVATASATITTTPTVAVAASAGNELSYAENIPGLVLTTAYQDLPAVIIAVTAPDEPFWLRGSAQVVINKGTGTADDPTTVQVDIVDTTDGGSTIVATDFVKQGLPSATSVIGRAFPERRMSFAAGTIKTYKLQAKITLLAVNSTASLLASDALPVYLRASLD